MAPKPETIFQIGWWWWHISVSPSLDSFKRRLKTHYFALQ